MIWVKAATIAALLFVVGTISTQKELQGLEDSYARMQANAVVEVDRTTPAEAKRIIRHVFGRYGSQAVAVSHCETGGTFSIWAGYGKHQYLGLFQMGSSERRTYGHAWNAWAQSRAAYRYFVASGRDWSPWTCKPW